MYIYIYIHLLYIYIYMYTRVRKQEKPVNVFKPGARDVRIVENEETGKLEKVKYKPPSDPNKVNEDQ